VKDLLSFTEPRLRDMRDRLDVSVRCATQRGLI
jgi:hypothetical protein